LGVVAVSSAIAIGGAWMATHRFQTRPGGTARRSPPPVVIAPPAAPTPAPSKKVDRSAPAPVKQAAKPDNVLSNKGVIDMVEAKVSPSLIMQLIRTSKTKFDLSVPEIIRLTKAGVPDEV